jgi:hypothetical protein
LQNEISGLKARHEDQLAKIRSNETALKKELLERDEKLE